MDRQEVEESSTWMSRWRLGRRPPQIGSSVARSNETWTATATASTASAAGLNGTSPAWTKAT
eukprot:11032033-Lingulodinium_polyedra.AAC.1